MLGGGYVWGWSFLYESHGLLIFDFATESHGFVIFDFGALLASGKSSRKKWLVSQIPITTDH